MSGVRVVWRHVPIYIMINTSACAQVLLPYTVYASPANLNAHSSEMLMPPDTSLSARPRQSYGTINKVVVFFSKVLQVVSNRFNWNVHVYLAGSWHTSWHRAYFTKRNEEGDLLSLLNNFHTEIPSTFNRGHSRKVYITIRIKFKQDILQISVSISELHFIHSPSVHFTQTTIAFTYKLL